MSYMHRRDVDVAATGRTIGRYKSLNHLSIPELADILHCSTQAVRSWLRGECLPTDNHLDALAEIFGVYTEDLVSFRGAETEVR